MSPRSCIPEVFAYRLYGSTEKMTAKLRRTSYLLSLGWLLVAAAAAPAAVPVDVVLVLDNSGSMKQNDPRGLMRQVATAFADRLPADCRLGIVLFDQEVELVLEPTETLTPTFAEVAGASLAGLDYGGRWTDLPAGLERATYELRTRGREEAEKVVVFLTDGIVDLGDPEEDRAQTRWLRDSLALEARDLGIRIFGVAFTEEADFRLIQSVSQITGGSYFRVLSAGDIPAVFAEINRRIEDLGRERQIPLPEPVVESRTMPAVPETPTAWTAAGVGLAVTAPVLAALGLALLFHRLRRPTAFLKGVGAQHPIARRVVTVGRDEGNDVVLDDDQVSLRHAEIFRRGSSFFVRDLRSSNGTFVNGRQIGDPATSKEELLKHRDVLRFGRSTFDFLEDDLRGDETRFAGQPLPFRIDPRVGTGTPSPRPASTPATEPRKVEPPESKGPLAGGPQDSTMPAQTPPAPPESPEPQPEPPPAGELPASPGSPPEPGDRDGSTTCSRCGCDLSAIADSDGLAAELRGIVEYRCEDCVGSPSEAWRTIAGYRLLRQLGKGGMGQVLETYHPATGRMLALKLMTDRRTRLRDRFRREKRLLREIRHPNVVRYVDEGDDRGHHFLVMERVEGGNLLTAMEEAGGRLPPDVVADLGCEVLEGLGFLHRRGIVHRDLKPQNILLDRGHDGVREWVPKIADFGLATPSLDGSTRLTTFSDVLGTPGFMAPEQIRSARDVDETADVFSLGVTLYYALTAKLPFHFDEGQDLRAIVDAKAAPIPIRQRDAAIPATLAAAIDRAVAWERSDRFATAAEFQRALRTTRAAAGAQEE